VTAIVHRRRNRPRPTSSSRPDVLDVASLDSNPPEGATYLIDPTLRSSYQTLAFRVSADRATGRIEWTVNGRTVGTSDSDKPLQWPLSPGTHRIVAADDRGRSAEATILVR
jgi:membrane carboxypeptidase/penicillin-binding protein PbpC